ncbi:MAG: hypothetical protein Q4G19_05780, partial [Clostridia bacterium]|nr:hypothetical protein [Clostridia bacterium]
MVQKRFVAIFMAIMLAMTVLPAGTLSVAEQLAEDIPVEETVLVGTSAPVEETPVIVEESPVIPESMPEEAAPAAEAMAEEVSAEGTPAAETPVEVISTEETPDEEVPAEVT